MNIMLLIAKAIVINLFVGFVYTQAVGGGLPLADADAQAITAQVLGIEPSNAMNRTALDASSADFKDTIGKGTDEDRGIFQKTVDAGISAIEGAVNVFVFIAKIAMTIALGFLLPITTITSINTYPYAITVLLSIISTIITIFNITLGIEIYRLIMNKQ